MNLLKQGLLLVAICIALNGCQTQRPYPHSNTTTDNVELVALRMDAHNDIQSGNGSPLVQVRDLNIVGPIQSAIIGETEVTSRTETLKSADVPAPSGTYWFGNERLISRTENFTRHKIQYKLTESMADATALAFGRIFTAAPTSKITGTIRLRPSFSNNIGYGIFGKYEYRRIFFEIFVSIEKDGKEVLNEVYAGAADERSSFGSLDGDGFSSLLSKAFISAFNKFAQSFPTAYKRSQF
tara:strand:- start:462 stop:1178 length:717 start_codon:yes stop_codon:yes gene_type:complete